MFTLASGSSSNLTMQEVSTTLPLVGDNLPVLRSARLIIRPLLLSDINSYSTLRSQPEAMTSSSRGRPDLNIDETREKLFSLQAPYQDSHVYFGIFLQNEDGSEGDFIGDGGVHKYKNTDTG
jgi:RimJ/RimL family protein N-acetyltransferase